MHALYDKLGHREREGIYRRIINRYWWEDMYNDIKKYV
jgi:hypothetical protein